MISDLLCTDNYVSYNIKIAQCIGLECAIYLSELINQEAFAHDKNRGIITGEDGTKYFALDRKGLTSRTTFDTIKQKELEETLSDLKYVKRLSGAPGYIQLNLEKLVGVLSSDNTEVLSEVKKIASTQEKKAASKASSKDYIFQKAREAISSPPGTPLNDALSRWLQSVQSKGINSELVKLTESKLDIACGSNTQKKLDIIQIATAMAWKDVDYAVDHYRKHNSGIISDVRPLASSEPAKPVISKPIKREIEIFI